MPPPKLVCSCTTGSPPCAGEAPHRADEQPLQALGEVGAAEELGRVAVLVRALAEVHLPEVGGELGLLVAAAGHVLCGVTTSRQGLRLPVTWLSMAVPALLRFSLRTCSSKRRRSSSIFIFSTSSACGAETAVSSRPAESSARYGIVAGERLLVRPAVAHVAQLAHQAAFGLAERLAEDLVPLIPHHGKSCGGIPARFFRCTEQVGLGVADRGPRRLEPALPIVGLHLALDEGPQALLEQVQRLANAVVIADGHGCCPLLVWGQRPQLGE